MKKLLLPGANALAALLLLACGGGSGGEGGTLPPTSNAIGRLDGTTGCTIKATTSSCSARIVAKTALATSPKIVVGTTSIPMAGAEVDTTYSIGQGDVTVSLWDGDVKKIDSIVISGSCESGSMWDGNACSAPVRPTRRYSEYKLVVDGTNFSFLSVLTDTSLVPLTNKSQYQAVPGIIAAPLYSCSLPEFGVMRSDGWLGVQLGQKCARVSTDRALQSPDLSQQASVGRRSIRWLRPSPGAPRSRWATAGNPAATMPAGADDRAPNELQRSEKIGGQATRPISTG